MEAWGYVKVVFICQTPYHLFNSLYYATFLKKYNINSIIINDSDKEYEGVEFEDKKIVKVHSEKKTKLSNLNEGYFFWKKNNHIKVLLTNIELVVCFNDQTNCSAKVIEFCKKHNNAKIALIEDGCGIYNEERKNVTIKKIVKKFLFGSVIVKQLGKNRYIDIIVSKDPKLLPKWITRNRELLQQQDVFEDKKFINSFLYKNEYLEELEKTMRSKKVILFLGQPVSELGIDESNQIAFLKKIATELSEYIIVVKPHPRDADNKYVNLANLSNIIIYENKLWYPAEVLSYVLHPIAAISVCSSATESFLAIGNSVVIYLYDMLGVKLENTYINASRYKKGIFFPENFRDVVTVIKNISNCVVDQCSKCNIESGDTFIEYIKEMVEGNIKNDIC